MKSQVLHTVWCHISGEAAGEIWHLITFGLVQKESNWSQYKLKWLIWHLSSEMVNSLSFLFNHILSLQGISSKSWVWTPTTGRSRNRTDTSHVVSSPMTKKNSSKPTLHCASPNSETWLLVKCSPTCGTTLRKSPILPLSSHSSLTAYHQREPSFCRRVTGIKVCTMNSQARPVITSWLRRGQTSPVSMCVLLAECPPLSTHSPRDWRNSTLLSTPAMESTESRKMQRVTRSTPTLTRWTRKKSWSPSLRFIWRTYTALLLHSCGTVPNSSHFFPYPPLKERHCSQTTPGVIWILTSPPSQTAIVLDKVFCTCEWIGNHCQVVILSTQEMSALSSEFLFESIIYLWDVRGDLSSVL